MTFERLTELMRLIRTSPVMQRVVAKISDRFRDWSEEQGPLVLPEDFAAAENEEVFKGLVEIEQIDLARRTGIEGLEDLYAYARARP